MFSLLSPLRTFMKFDSAIIDNSIFRLHYRATVLILVASSLLVTGKQFIGDPIDCMETKKVPANLLDTFCWIHTTFSVDEAWHKPVGKDGQIPYPGVDRHREGQKRSYHAYYQWVCFVLFFQAILFYVPRYFWKAFEGGQVKNMILGLNSPIMPREERRAKNYCLAEYILRTLNSHNMSFVAYVISEMLNFINVVGQMFLMDKFLNGHFTTYGPKVVTFTEWDWSIRYDPMIRVFPRLTKCVFSMFGSSGGLEIIDTMCILPINIINEKIYVFLWFWFVALSVLSGFVLLYRVLMIASPLLRLKMLYYRTRMTQLHNLELVIQHCNIGDWMLLGMLAKNLDPLNFRDLIEELARKLRVKEPMSELFA